MNGFALNGRWMQMEMTKHVGGGAVSLGWLRIMACFMAMVARSCALRTFPCVFALGGILEFLAACIKENKECKC